MKQGFRKILILVSVVVGLWAGAITAYASQFEITNDNVNIRAEANRTSASVGSTSRGNTFTIEGEATDSENYTWYRVKLTGDTYGYIRSDMGRVTGETSGDAEPVPHREATVNQNGVRVRSGPSTSHGEVANLPNGSSIIITGEGKDSAGRVWYQIKAIVDNQEVIGFVRSDLITPGDFIEMDVDEPLDDYVEDNAGEDVPSVDVGSDTTNEQLNFEIRYTQNDVGGYDYYLYDRAQGTQWRIEGSEGILALISSADALQKSYAERDGRQRTIIIVLAVVIVILMLVLTVLIFKIRDLNEDAEMDLRSFRPNPDGVKKPGTRPPDGRPAGSRPVKRSPERASDPDNPRPADRREAPGRKEGSQGSQGNQSSQGNARPRRPVDGEPKASERTENGDKGPRPERKEKSADAPKRAEQPQDEKQVEAPKATGEKPAPARKPQNFLADDDEFEFEFLNIDE